LYFKFVLKTLKINLNGKTRLPQHICHLIVWIDYLKKKYINSTHQRFFITEKTFSVTKGNASKIFEGARNWDQVVTLRLTCSTTSLEKSQS